MKCSICEMMLKVEFVCVHFCVLYVLNVGVLRIFRAVVSKQLNGNMVLEVIILNSMQATTQDRNCVSL